MIVKFAAKAAIGSALVLVLFVPGFTQKRPVPKKASVVRLPATDLPRVTQIDIEGLRNIIKPKGKPLLINFWATWCDPCREEFPELVKIDRAYKGKIDFVTVSLDDLADIKTFVPKFLGEMKADMPAYLLKTPDESAAITMVSKDWAGNLPLTILLTPSGDTVYSRNGKIKYELAAVEIDKLLAPSQFQ